MTLRRMTFLDCREYSDRFGPNFSWGSFRDNIGNSAVCPVARLTLDTQGWLDPTFLRSPSFTERRSAFNPLQTSSSGWKSRRCSEGRGCPSLSTITFALIPPTLPTLPTIPASEFLLRIFRIEFRG